MKKLIYSFLLSALLLISCGKNNDTINEPNIPDSKFKGVYIINEGLYGQNNSTISFYDFELQTVTNNIYENANSGNFLGDTANEIEVFDNKGYIAVANSNKIEIIDLASFKSLGFVDLGSNGSPRDIVIIDSTLGYVTSLMQDQLIKFNPTTKQVIKAISVGSKPEGAVYAAGKIYVANSGFGFDKTVSVIDITTDMVEKTLTVGMNPRFIYKLDNNNVYIVCTGNYDAVGRGGVYHINTQNQTVSDSIIINGNPSKSTLLKNNKMAVINNSGVIKVDLTTKTADETPFISAMYVNGIYGMIYAIAFDEQTEQLYLGNPKDFQQNGEILVFDLNGNELKRFDVGITPGKILIVR